MIAVTGAIVPTFPSRALARLFVVAFASNAASTSSAGDSPVHLQCSVDHGTVDPRFVQRVRFYS
jgi:hypothetical protein